MLVMLTELLSGLALFLFGMKFMSEGLQKAAGDKMRVILDRVTRIDSLQFSLVRYLLRLFSRPGQLRLWRSALLMQDSLHWNSPLVLHLVPILVRQLLHSLFL